MHNINTRSKHHFHRPVANLSHFQKGTSYSGIKIFNSLPRSITSLMNEKTQFRIALKKFLYAHSFYSVDEFFACTDDIWYMTVVNVYFTLYIFIYLVIYNCFAPKLATKVPFGSSDTLPGNQLDSLQIDISSSHCYLIC